MGGQKKKNPRREGSEASCSTEELSFKPSLPFTPSCPDQSASTPPRHPRTRHFPAEPRPRLLALLRTLLQPPPPETSPKPTASKGGGGEKPRRTPARLRNLPSRCPAVLLLLFSRRRRRVPSPGGGGGGEGLVGWLASAAGARPPSARARSRCWKCVGKESGTERGRVFYEAI